MMGAEETRVSAVHPSERKHTILLDFLEQEQISKELRDGILEYRKTYSTPPELRNRVPQPQYRYYGKEVWEAAIAAILCGENLLLAGSKATGKNVLAENLAQVFARPSWNVSFHVNIDAASLIGTDTFENGQVTFRPGPVYLCARYGGFGILDEINMAKNEALAVLHAALDFRRSIDVPGYDRVDVDPAARFIGTMNYGYAGTRELNEALTSRQSGAAADRGISHTGKEIPRTVRAAVSRASDQMRERRDFLEGARSPRNAGRAAADSKGAQRRNRARHGYHEQGFRQL